MLHILVVDDERIIREGVRAMIERGCSFPLHVDMADSGCCALEMMKTCPPDLAFVDINMPEMDGFAFIDEALSRGYRGQFVMLTGYDEYDYAIKAIRRQVLDYMLKPVDERMLMELLSRINGQREKMLAVETRQSMRDLKAWIVYQEPVEELETDSEELRALFPRTYLTAAMMTLPEDASPPGDAQLCAAAAQVASESAVSAVSLRTHQGLFTLFGSDRPLDPRALISALYALMASRGFADERVGLVKSELTVEALPKLPQCYLHAWRNGISARIADPEIYSAWLAEGIDLDVPDHAAVLRLPHASQRQATQILERIAEELASHQPWGYLVGYTNICASLSLMGVLQMLATNLPRSTFLQRCRGQREPITKAQFIFWSRQALDEMRRSEPADRNATYTPNVRRAIQYIEAEYASIQSIDQVASHVHLHPNYLSALLSRELGVTFVRYLNDLRVKRAMRLLADDENATVEWVAEMTGFQTVRYFYKVFKEIAGISPGRYHQRAHRGEGGGLT